MRLIATGNQGDCQWLLTCFSTLFPFILSEWVGIATRRWLQSKHSTESSAATNNIDCREGDWHPTRIVMLEFPSMEKARAWYDSPEYQEVLPIRLDANRDKMVIFEGLP